jgi:predicted PurR-regulated permease PerM
MKNVFLVILVCLAFKGRTQTQALEQLQLNIEKLAQLKLMLTNMYNTYSILNERVQQHQKHISSIISNCTKGLLTALSNISPAVRNAILLLLQIF